MCVPPIYIYIDIYFKKNGELYNENNELWLLFSRQTFSYKQQ